MPAKRPRLLLVQPGFDNPLLDRNRGTLPPLGLAYVAAYTPPDWDVVAIDEQVDSGPLPPADLVGLTTTTLTVHRAYEIAARYRARGTPVVLGGVHASMCPDEALQAADAVVIGDAEPVWPEVLDDARAGRLRSRYHAPPADLAGLRRPRLDLFRGRYTFAPVSASRGCPFRCEFCAINRFYDGTCRRRPTAEVVAELRDVARPNVFFTDGNLYGYSPRDREDFLALCRALTAARRTGRMNAARWMCYASLNALDDDEGLALAHEAGCRALFVGFESIEPESLREMRKTVNLRYGPEAYGALIRRAQRHGLLVVGELVVGSDHDTPETLARTAAFIRESGLDLLRLQILQPLPGTDLFERLRDDGRLLLHDFPADWRKLAADFVMGVHYTPRQIERTALQRWTAETGRAFYAPATLALRVARIAARTRAPLLAALVLANSLKSRKTYVNYEIHGS